MKTSLLLVCIILFSICAATAGPNADGHIHADFIFKCYENGKDSRLYIYLDVVIGRNEQKPYAFCKLVKIERAWFQDDDNVKTLNVVDVEVSKLTLSNEVDQYGCLKSASFYLLFPVGEGQLITIEDTKENGRSFEAHARGVTKTLDKSPKLIDVEWRQIDKIEFPNGTVIVPF